MASGIAVDPECLEAFNLMSTRNKYKYLIFVVDGKKIALEDKLEQEAAKVDSMEASDAAYEQMFESLKTSTNNWKDCRYAVFDFLVEVARQAAGTAMAHKMVFLQVCPEGAPIKKKMIYASSSNTIRATLGSEKFHTIQISDESELDYKQLIEQIKQKSRLRS